MVNEVFSVSEEEAQKDAEYDKLASQESKRAIFLWLIGGAVYAEMTWHLLFLPAILLFMPGIFLTSAIAFVFFLPVWLITQKARKNRSWLLLIIATVIRIFGLVAPVYGGFYYIKFLRIFIQ